MENERMWCFLFPCTFPNSTYREMPESTPPIISRPESSDSSSSHKGLFGSTPWSDVVAAGASGHQSQRQALESLCSAYWLPLYLYVLRKSNDVHLAQDLTQSFFERMLAGKFLKLADPARGRFRTFLVRAIEWHLANEFRESKAAKRGGGVQFIPLDFSAHNPAMVDDACLSAEELFEREWALTLLRLTMERLRSEQFEGHKGEQFEALKVFLTGDGPAGGYAEVCKQLGLQEPAARMVVSRLRTRFRELIREEIHKTVASSQDADDEIRQLFRALSGRLPR